uniref:Uncharacterized protein n=1 Tax=Timema cristinae TaxID=61476 RepID=A0A7R9DMA8_TIMCR|nr:unnamed protein product [Timema cristinae]
MEPVSHRMYHHRRTHILRQHCNIPITSSHR